MREDGEVHPSAVDVKARANPDPEPEHLRERHDVPLLEVPGAALEVLISGLGPANGWGGIGGNSACHGFGRHTRTRAGIIITTEVTVDA